MKIVIIVLATIVSFIGGIITHYGYVLERGPWTLCGITLFVCGMFIAMFVSDLR